jgi:hypothetical protein
VLGLIDGAAARAVRIHLLQRDDVWRERSDDGGDPVEVDNAVATSAVPNVVRHHAQARAHTIL